MSTPDYTATNSLRVETVEEISTDLVPRRSSWENNMRAKSSRLLPPIVVEGADDANTIPESIIEEWNSLPANVFPENYDLDLLKARVNRLFLGISSPIPWKTRSSSGSRMSRAEGGSARSVSPLPLDRNPNSPKYSKFHDQTKCSTIKSSLNGDVEMMHYFNQNKDLIETYVIEHLPLVELEKWFQMKLKTQRVEKISPIYQMSSRKLTRYKYKPSKKQIFMNLVKSLQEDPSEQTVVWQLARSISKSVGVDAYRVFKLNVEQKHIVQYFVYEHNQHADDSTPSRLIRADPKLSDLVLEVVKRGTTYSMARDKDPLRFPDVPHALFKAFRIRHVTRANYVIYQPILSSGCKISYVIEMWRIRDSFKETDEETSSNFLVWGSLALHYCNLYLEKKNEKNMNDFLLDVVKAIFEEMVSLDQLIKRILEFAQKLVNADRASLFLVDFRNFELVSTVFDLKFETGNNKDVEKKEIRMPINRGIAGHVALSGETMNIPDAYSDYRFNRSVDEATGYKTVSILCMPIKVQRKVIGVVQMVNKRSENTFDGDDEVAFEIFSTFFGLALHHARLYDKIMRKEQKYRVALEVLSYHNTCKENEVHTILHNDEDMKINNLNNYYLDPYMLNELSKCKAVIKMFDELFDLSQFDVLTVTRFVLTVKKNYRNVPYHNFDHGWSVAQVMYVILKNETRKRFTYVMRLALFVACLCHDLDHRGYTNKYMSETASPLAAMYTTSTLEHHHFNITVTILQQDGHNIFSHLSSDNYKEILSVIRQCILATDLAAFFPNLAKIKNLHQQDQSTSDFDWGINNHRDLAMAISMTAADLSASAKPWEVQIKTVKIIFEEFYDQGDKELASGKIPIAMMDRRKPEEQAASQVGFLSQICIPCYEILQKILPNTKPMYLMAMKNLQRWQKRADRVLANPHQTNCYNNFDKVDSDDDNLENVSEQLEFSINENENEDIDNSGNDDSVGLIEKDVDKKQVE